MMSSGALNGDGGKFKRVFDEKKVSFFLSSDYTKRSWFGLSSSPRRQVPCLLPVSVWRGATDHIMMKEATNEFSFNLGFLINVPLLFFRKSVEFCCCCCVVCFSGGHDNRRMFSFFYANRRATLSIRASKPWECHLFRLILIITSCFTNPEGCPPHKSHKPSSNYTQFTTDQIISRGMNTICFGSLSAALLPRSSLLKTPNLKNRLGHPTMREDGPSNTRQTTNYKGRRSFLPLPLSRLSSLPLPPHPHRRRRLIRHSSFLFIYLFLLCASFVVSGKKMPCCKNYYINFMFLHGTKKDSLFFLRGRMNQNGPNSIVLKQLQQRKEPEKKKKERGTYNNSSDILTKKEEEVKDGELGIKSTYKGRAVINQSCTKRTAEELYNSEGRNENYVQEKRSGCVARRTNLESQDGGASF
ncbi:hypothetical protein VP01_496g4 [Puccinia sorghi]|uniref:Uncharacterized protein n=1 Tax=Puccinia sorghi TaxID=27349 RepID=A0A0L6UNU9_9BASI|nr:hypothetical protein VP01_496g4 [Puccinia sorghi]